MSDVKNPYVIPFSWRNLAVVLLVSGVLWLGPLAIWPWKGRETRRPGVRKPSMVRFLGNFQSMDGAAWSPVMFPLPTQYGFSESPRSMERGDPRNTILSPRTFSGMFLDVALPDTPEVALGAIDRYETGLQFRPVSNGAGNYGASVDTGTVWRIVVDDTLRGRGYPVESVEAGLPATDGWGRIDAYVELDRGGVPLHVLVEGSSGNPVLARQIARVLYGGRGRPSLENTGGRVQVLYRGWEAGRATDHAVDRDGVR